MVPEIKRKETYDGDGATRYWDITFQYSNAADIHVYLTPPDGNSIEITENFDVDTTLNRVEYPTVVSGLDPVAEGYKVTVARVSSRAQESDYRNQGDFSAESVEDDLDGAFMVLQEHDEELSRCVKRDISTSSESGADYLLQCVAARDAALDAQDAAETAQGSAQTYSGQAESHAGDASGYAAAALGYRNEAQAAAGKITVSATEPSSPSEGDIWIDIS